MPFAWRIWKGNPKNAVEIFFGLAVLFAAAWIAGLVTDALYFLVIVALAFRTLIGKYKRADGIWKKSTFGITYSSTGG